MDDEELAAFVEDPQVEAMMDAMKCEESHDLEHHWPLNIDTQLEREGCIYCGVTKRSVMFKVVKGRSSRGPVPPRGRAPGRTERSGTFKAVKIDAETFRKIFEGDS